MRKSLIKSLHYWKQWATAKQGTEKERGLTLIEMLAVVVILGIVAAIAIPAVSSAIAQSKVNATESTLGTLQTALSRYELDNGSYPANLSDLDVNPVTGPATWSGPYTQDVFPLADGWGNYIWYVPLYSTVSSSGTTSAPGTPITGYLLLSGDSQALSVSTASSGADLDLGTTPYTDAAGQDLIYAAGGNGSNIDPTTVAASTYLGVGPTSGVLPASLYDVIDGTATTLSTAVPVDN